MIRGCTKIGKSRKSSYLFGPWDSLSVGLSHCYVVNQRAVKTEIAVLRSEPSVVLAIPNRWVSESACPGGCRANNEIKTPKFQIRNRIVPRQLVPHTMWRMSKLDAVAFIVRSSAGRQARWRAKRGCGDRRTACRNHQGRAGTGTGREPPVAPAPTRSREGACSPGESVKSAQTKAASEVARLKEKNKELQIKLRHMWDWHNNEITKAGGLTFKASSLIAKALHPDSMPSEEVRLEAFKAFSAWKGDRDAARRR